MVHRKQEDFVTLHREHVSVSPVQNPLELALFHRSPQLRVRQETVRQEIRRRPTALKDFVFAMQMEFNQPTAHG
jgi:hypothetical protein